MIRKLVLLFLVLVLSAGCAHATLVVSDNFSDGNYDGWSVEKGAMSAENGYLQATGYSTDGEGLARISVPSTVTHGTWKFKYCFPNGIYEFSRESSNYKIGMKADYLRDSGDNVLRFNNPIDGHWWLDYLKPDSSRIPHAGYVIQMVGSSVYTATPSIDITSSGWHEVTFVLDENNYSRMYYDGQFVRWTQDKIVDIGSSQNFTLSIYDTSDVDGFSEYKGQYPIYLDDVEIYENEYLYPENTVSYNESLDAIVINDVNTSLCEINTGVNDQAKFSYNAGTNTATAHKDIILDEGASLRIINGTLLMNSTSEGERKFIYYTDAGICLDNSRIDTTNNYAFTWQRGSGKNLVYKNQFSVVNSTINNCTGLYLDRPTQFNITDSRLTNFNGTTEIKFYWPPRDLALKNSVFTGKTTSDMIRFTGGDQFRNIDPIHRGIDITDCDFSGIILSGISGVHPAYMNILDPPCTLNLINTTTVNMALETARVQTHPSITLKYLNGSIVEGATVIVTNEQDNTKYQLVTSATLDRYVQLSGQVNETGVQYFGTSQLTNYILTNKYTSYISSMLTNSTGEIESPSYLVTIRNETQPLTYTVFAEKDGITTTKTSINLSSPYTVTLADNCIFDGYTRFTGTNVTGSTVIPFNALNAASVNVTIANYYDDFNIVNGVTFSHVDKYSISDFSADTEAQLSVSYNDAMQADFDDIRFVDGNYEVLSYWIESKTDSTNATAWIKTKNSSDVYCVYGNADAVSESDPELVFLFYDGFDELNTSVWTVTNPDQFSVTDGKLTCTGSDSTIPYITSIATYDHPGLAIEQSIDVSSVGVTTQKGYTMFLKSTVLDGVAWYPGNYRYVYGAGNLLTADNSPTGRGLPTGNSRVSLKKWENNITMTTGVWEESWAGTTNNAAKSISLFESRADNVVTLDWVALRKFAGVEQTVTLVDDDIGLENVPGPQFTLSVTGDADTDTYSSSPKTASVVPTDYISSFDISTGSTDYDYTADVYWSEYIPDGNEASELPGKKFYIDYIPRENITDGNITATFVATLPEASIASGTIDTVSKTATKSGQDVTIETGELDTTSHEIVLTVPAYAPIAAFTANETDGTAPLDVQFTDASTQSPTAWAWNFGDGTNSTEQNPVHTYESDGNYTVSLTVTNALGSDTETKTGYIKLTNPYVAPAITLIALAAVLFMRARRRW